MRATIPQIARMMRLRRARLSYAAIAAVMNLDYGASFDAESVRGYCVRNGAPRIQQGKGMHTLSPGSERIQNFGVKA